MCIPYKIPRVWPAFLAFALLIIGCGEPGQPNITASLRGQTEYQLGRPVNITFTLSNASPADLFLLKWGTPFEGFRSMFFIVEKDGQKLEYRGRTVKRGEPTKDDYLKITFGEISLVTLDLTQAFDLSKTGTYTLKLATNIIDYAWDETELPRSSANHVSYSLTALPITFKIVQ